MSFWFVFTVWPDLSLATDGAISYNMTTDYKAEKATYDSFVQKAKKVRKQVIEQDQAKPPARRLKVCLTWFAAAISTPTDQELEDTMASIGVTDNDQLDEAQKQHLKECVAGFCSPRFAACVCMWWPPWQYHGQGHYADHRGSLSGVPEDGGKVSAEIPQGW